MHYLTAILIYCGLLMAFPPAETGPALASPVIPPDPSAVQLTGPAPEAEPAVHGEVEREMVGARGFEPPASATPLQRASQAAPRPDRGPVRSEPENRRSTVEPSGRV